MEELWAEWDEGVVKPSGNKTPSLRHYCQLETASWRGTTGSKMRMMLLRRRHIWEAMDKLVARAPGSMEEKKNAMFQELHRMKTDSRDPGKIKSNKQLSESLKGFE